MGTWIDLKRLDGGEMVMTSGPFRDRWVPVVILLLKYIMGKNCHRSEF